MAGWDVADAAEKALEMAKVVEADEGRHRCHAQRRFPQQPFGELKLQPS